MSQQTKKQPAYKNRRGLLDVAAWENEGQNGTFYSFVLRRSFQDGSGQWNESKLSLRRQDLLVAARMLVLASDWDYQRAAEAKADQSGPGDAVPPLETTVQTVGATDVDIPF